LIPRSLYDIPAEDPVVYDMLCKADTVGVFQIESRAQMSMLPRLKPRCFYDLVIEVAIVRPGPIQGGMVHPYLRRRDGREPATYPDERVRSVLAKTLGVPLFQEQVMQLAVVAAGFTPGEADQLRRAMAAWRRQGSLEPFYVRLVNGMLANGYTRDFAEVVFKQISGFAEYGFPESHAASFALLVYSSAWLKRYHPAVFCAALLNAQPLGFYTPGQLIRDAQAHGVEIQPVDVNESEYDCVLQSDEATKRRSDEGDCNGGEHGPPARSLSDVDGSLDRLAPDARAGGPCSPSSLPVRLGFRVVRGLNADRVAGIVAARTAGPITSLRALARRPDVPRDTLIRLAAADAFRSLGLTRRQALWEVLALDREPQGTLFDDLADETGAEAAESRRGGPSSALALPLPTPTETVTQDYDALGFSLNAHPLELVRADLTRLNVLTSRAIRESRASRRVRVAGLVTVRQRPGTAKGIVFMTLEDEAGLANLIVRPPVWERYGRPTRTAQAVVAEGTVERQGLVVHVLVSAMWELGAQLATLRHHSRDFH
jgi:error-prone DNA polymerase